MFNFLCQSILPKKLLKFSVKRTFDQYLIRPKRHFTLTYKYKGEDIEDLKQSKCKI